MSIQTLIQEIGRLNMQELELVFQVIQKKIKARKQAEGFLDSFIGAGSGIWDLDSQDYVNELRAGDR